MNLQDPATNDFVLVLVVGALVLVVLVPALYRRLTARYGYRAPIRPTRPSRPVDVRLGHSQGIRCLHCPATLDTFVQLDMHMRFDCPGLKRREQE